MTNPSVNPSAPKNLADIGNDSISVATYFDLAMLIILEVKKCHDQGIPHGAIQLNHFLYHPETQTVTFAATSKHTAFPVSIETDLDGLFETLMQLLKAATRDTPTAVFSNEARGKVLLPLHRISRFANLYAMPPIRISLDRLIAELMLAKEFHDGLEIQRGKERQEFIKSLANLLDEKIDSRQPIDPASLNSIMTYTKTAAEEKTLSAEETTRIKNTCLVYAKQAMQHFLQTTGVVTHHRFLALRETIHALATTVHGLTHHGKISSLRSEIAKTLQQNSLFSRLVPDSVPKKIQPVSTTAELLSRLDEAFENYSEEKPSAPTSGDKPALVKS